MANEAFENTKLKSYQYKIDILEISMGNHSVL